MKRLQEWWNIFKNSFQLYSNHDTMTLGAALSYYTAFSVVPIIIIIISITGVILGPEAVQGGVKAQLQGLLGAHAAEQLQDIIKAAYKPGTNLIATIVAVILLVVGATSVFGQLRTSLNSIWNVKPQVKKPVVKFLVDRLFSFAMIACMAFLLLVTLVVHAGLSAFTNYLDRLLPNVSVILIKVLDIVISFGLTTVLFAFIYKYMSDAKPLWRSVWGGAIFTALLFALGKYLIGVYISKGNVGETYGAAGSIVVLLTWVFYSSQILFYGAEFTRALAVERGVSLDPTAVKTDKESHIENKKVIEVKK